MAGHSYYAAGVRLPGKNLTARSGLEVLIKPLGQTPQGVQVERFGARGLHTREVGAQPFLSTRTDDFHLRNVFTKLGISSPTELARFPWDRQRSFASNLAILPATPGGLIA